MKKFAPLFLALATSAAAQQVTRVPMVLPSVNAYAVYFPAPSPALIPMSMPGSVSVEIAVPLSLPAPRPVPNAITPLSFPGAKNPFPLPTPLIVAQAEVVPALPVVDAVQAVVPARPALNELRDTVIGREPIRVQANKAFDGRRETVREAALPSGRIFKSARR
ncbi:MAG: hypothetical protein M0D55_13035 [Elusimicrobiota bacterium]|nr:MAG: hypothetical protein M0D55_13035 [Elusimicrobiota bacterium]